MLLLLLFAITIIIILIYIYKKFWGGQANTKYCPINIKNKPLLENNFKTFFVITIFFYLVTFPLYHPEKAKIKKEKIKAFEFQKLEHDNFYKKKVELDPKNSIYFKNQSFISNLKDDKLFFQFPQRKKKRLELLTKLNQEKIEILNKLQNKNLNLVDKNNLINDLKLIEEKIKNLERYFN